ncbi:MAG: M50 family metallopeptidase [Chloroflexi bacterium]|nr:M50 family metallopeptidase [Chloroflexota bacterium]
MPVMPGEPSVEDLINELEAGGVIGDKSARPPATRPKAAAPATKEAPARALRTGEVSGLLFLIVAAVLIALVGSLPFGSLVFYPFALFVTLIHESSHAIAGLLTGGSVGSLQISPDLSGVTRISGGLQAVIAPAGYLGSTLAGVALLMTPLRRARWALGALAAIPVLALLLFHPATLFTVLWCLGFAACLGLGAWKLPFRLAAFLQILLGVEAGLNAFRDLTDLIFISGSGAHIQTDADNMSRALFLPPTFWAVLWTVLSTMLLVGACYRLVRRAVRR